MPTCSLPVEFYGPSLLASFFLFPSLFLRDSLLLLRSIREEVSPVAFSRSPPHVSYALRVFAVVCDLAIPQRATPYRSRRPVVQREGRKRREEGELSAINVYFRQGTSSVGTTRGMSTTRRRIVNSTVRPDGGMPDTVKSETDHVDSGISVRIS